MIWPSYRRYVVMVLLAVTSVGLGFVLLNPEAWETQAIVCALVALALLTPVPWLRRRQRAGGSQAERRW